MHEKEEQESLLCWLSNIGNDPHEGNNSSDESKSNVVIAKIEDTLTKLRGERCELTERLEDELPPGVST